MAYYDGCVASCVAEVTVAIWLIASFCLSLERECVYVYLQYMDLYVPKFFIGDKIRFNNIENPLIWHINFSNIDFFHIIRVDVYIPISILIV